MAKKNKNEIVGQIQFVPDINNGIKYIIPEVYKNDVKKSNILILFIALDLSVIELRLINHLTTLMKPPHIGTDGNKVYCYSYTIKFKDICIQSHMPVNGKSYQLLYDGLVSLKKKSFTYIMSDVKQADVTFINGDIIRTPGKASFEVSKLMTPLLLDKKDNFTLYNPRYSMILKSKYSVRTYEWLTALLKKEICIGEKKLRKRYKNGDIKELTKDEKKEYVEKYNKNKHAVYDIKINMETYRNNLAVPKSIEGYQMLANKILSRCKEEINMLSDIMIEDCFYEKETNSVVIKTRLKTTEELTIVDEVIEKIINDIDEM